jgi:hypothetical protein
VAREVFLSGKQYHVGTGERATGPAILNLATVVPWPISASGDRHLRLGVWGSAPEDAFIAAGELGRNAAEYFSCTLVM